MNEPLVDISLNMSIHDHPLVSVGCPIFNGEERIESALDSVVSQNYKNLEIVVSDNASSDKTLQICERYASLDKRIVVLSSRINRGLRWNFVCVLVESSGKYFMWLAHDDVIGPEYISLCLAEFSKNERLVLSGTSAAIKSPSGSKNKTVIEAGCICEI